MARGNGVHAAYDTFVPVLSGYGVGHCETPGHAAQIVFKHKSDPLTCAT
jgi:hypothetical protein